MHKLMVILGSCHALDSLLVYRIRRCLVVRSILEGGLAFIVYVINHLCVAIFHDRANTVNSVELDLRVKKFSTLEGLVVGSCTFLIFEGLTCTVPTNCIQ